MAGPTLKKLVTRQMMLNPQRVYSDAAAIDICLQIARGLQYLHSAKPMVRRAARDGARVATNM
jgi:hypothetical protein